MGIYRLKPWKDQKLAKLALWLHHRHIKANQVTFFGLISGVGAAVSLGRGHISVGLSLIILSVFADLMDGAVARRNCTESIFGKFFDATCDRIVEASWVGALIFLNIIPWWGWLLPIGSVLLLMARIYAFLWRLDTTFVRFARFERMTVLIAALILPWHGLIYPLYLAVACATLFSVMQIGATIYRQSASCHRPNSARCHS